MTIRLGIVLGTLGVSWGIAVALSTAAPPPRVEVCHFQEAEGTWKLLTLPLPATVSHIRTHDDTFPGGTTARTGTALDETCAPVGATSCPCDGLTNPPAVWGEAFVTGACVVDAAQGAQTLIGAPPSTGVLHVSADTATCSLAVGGTTPVVEVTGLSSGEVVACQASLQAIATADSVLCIALQ